MPHIREHPSPPQPLEITVTHRAPIPAVLVKQFFENKLIVIGTAALGIDRANYPSELVNDFDCMDWLRQYGGAVIANYPGCLDPGKRVIGRAVAARSFMRFDWQSGKEPLFGLRLDPWDIVDPSILKPTKDLRPHSRAIATCHLRTEGRLDAAVRRL